jgi:hypothetical protein
MTTQDAFELWIKSDWPEVDLTRLPSGNYRIKSTQDKWEGWQAGRTDGYEDGFGCGYSTGVGEMS